MTFTARLAGKQCHHIRYTEGFATVRPHPLSFHLEADYFPFSVAGLNAVMDASVPGSSGLTLPGLINQQSTVSVRSSLVGRSGRRKQQETAEVT